MKLLLKFLSLPECTLVFPILQKLPIERKGDFIFVKIILANYQILIRHSILNKSGLFVSHESILHLIHQLFNSLLILPFLLLMESDHIHLLVFQLLKVMMASECAYLQHILKFGEISENLLQVLILQTINTKLRLNVCSLNRLSIFVLVANLENVTRIANIAALVKHQNNIVAVFVRHFHLSIVDEV